METSTKLSTIIRSKVANLQIEVIERSNTIGVNVEILLSRIDPYSMLQDWTCNRNQAIEIVQEVLSLFLATARTVDTSNGRLPGGPSA